VSPVQNSSSVNPGFFPANPISFLLTPASLYSYLTYTRLLK